MDDPNLADDMVIALGFPEPEDPEKLGKIIKKAQNIGKALPGVKIMMTKGDAAAAIRFFMATGELEMEDVPPDGTQGIQYFKKKPVKITAVQLSWRTWSQVCEFLGDVISEDNPGYNIPLEEVSDTCGEQGPEYIAVKVITTHGEEAIVRHGDWIIPDSKPGTFYPCKPDVFAATYSAVIQ